MNETWKKIPDYEMYEVSNQGSIRNAVGRILSTECDRDGYLKVTLCKDGKRKNFSLHRIVANAFVDNPYKKDTVDHINGIKTDNRSSNLQWMTARENLQKYHSERGHRLYDVVKRKTGMKRGESRRIPIIQITKEGAVVAKYKSLMDAERMTGIGSGRISLCINGIKKTAGGYLWKKETI